MSTEKKKTVLCIGTAVLDITARPIGASDSWKEKQRISDIRLQVGGDAANQSIHLAALGYHAMLNACIGADANGETIRSALRARGVDDHLMRVKQDSSTGTALLLVSPEGERHIFSVYGAHSTLDGGDLPEQMPEDCCAVSLGSLFSIPLAEEDGLQQFLRGARERKIPVFADLDSGRVEANSERVLALLPLVDYFLPSCYDVLPLTGKDTLEDAAAFLRDLGVGEVIVKCGEKGCEVFGSSFSGKIPSVPVKPVDTTGAGDCMSAAFIARILAGDGIEEACRYACAAGALSTLYPGANGIHLTDQAVRELQKKLRHAEIPE